MAVKISFGKGSQTPEQKFLSALQEWMNVEATKVDAAFAEQQYNKEHGKGGLELYKAMASAHGPYATMGACRAFKRFSDKLSSLSALHKPEFD